MHADLGLSLVRTFGARAVASLGGVVLLVVVARDLGPEAVGGLALAQALLLGSSLLARGGMDNALMRYVGRDASSSYVFLYLWWAIRHGLIISVPVSLLLMALRGYIETWFDSPGLSSILLGIAFSVPAYVFSFLLSGFFKGIRMPATASLMENGSVSLLSALFLWFWYAYYGEIGYAAIGWVHFLASLLVAFQGAGQLWLWNRSKRSVAPCGSDPVQYKDFKSTSRAFFVATFANFMQTVVAIMIAGLLLSDVGLGLFKSAQQVGMFISFVLIVINAVFPPRFAMLYHEGDFKGLDSLARRGALIGIILALPPLSICLIFPAWVLGFLGDEFVRASSMLRVIALAQLVNVATGSVGFLLNMTGHERLMRNIGLICNGFGLLGFWLFIPLWGPMGAALALAFILVVQNITALLYVWKKLGIWTLPCPNFFALIGIETEVKRAS
ncbi:MAG: hypothetical protein CL537_02515 [Alcanivoracaceae bacterium]|nr:hypothetical protein [Alcanivoracaceae bacterium]|tara:strand:- start:1318 stop:2646 length:1329 start_codon:yes stop_codon:yes gene_type:complete